MNLYLEGYIKLQTATGPINKDDAAENEIEEAIDATGVAVYTGVAGDKRAADIGDV